MRGICRVPKTREFHLCLPVTLGTPMSPGSQVQGCWVSCYCHCIKTKLKCLGDYLSPDVWSKQMEAMFVDTTVHGFCLDQPLSHASIGPHTPSASVHFQTPLCNPSRTRAHGSSSLCLRALAQEWGFGKGKEVSQV